MLHIHSSVRVAASDGDNADRHDRCGNTRGFFVRGELGLPSQRKCIGHLINPVFGLVDIE